MNHYKNGAVLSHDRMVRATAEEIKIMHTKCMGPDDMITSLSGGNQQKVIFGKWLERSPSVFMMDDPTRGIEMCIRDSGCIEVDHRRTGQTGSAAYAAPVYGYYGRYRDCTCG